ncbi:MAG TPA: prepilin peptidase [Candidatus Omnitrophota bacterium]|nr:prepilin peptidase [Candidatus Omnitrophota bacterium]HPD84969.1 prepilin peptidase [Candidatus Omnitrophota bacterium]HRZ03827.1 prepilin peptidase [Candidatus Omnitrophota bacterium]
MVNLVNDPLIAFFVFLFGLIIGSFLNVCIVRMPQEKSVVFPGSHCVRCQKPIPWYDNIPLISYLLLLGRCRFCKEKISIRYFIVELLTGIAFVLFYLVFGLTGKLLVYLILLSGLIISTFIDIEHRIIPDEISLGGIVVGLIFSFLIPGLHDTSSHFMSLGKSLLGVLIGGGCIYAMGLLGDFLFKKESMGGGDVKLLAMIGAFLGWKLALLTFFVAPLFGAVVGIIVKIRTKDSLIPYGPFLALAAIISLFWSKPLIDWILSGYGLYR